LEFNKKSHGFGLQNLLDFRLKTANGSLPARIVYLKSVLMSSYLLNPLGVDMS
jgi:hypothetical protein